MIISNISMAILGLVDTAVIGHLDTAVYLAGVAVGSVIFDFLYWGMGFLRMGAIGVTAQVYGQNDGTEVRTILGQSVLIGLSVAILMLLFQNPIIKTGLFLLEGSPEVKHYAIIYCKWMIWGVPALMFLFSVSGWFLGMQNAFAALTIGIIVNVINIILDIILVVVFEMDVRGVALATVIAQYLGVILAMVLIRKELANRAGEWLLAKIVNSEKLKQFLRLNHDIFIKNNLFNTGLCFFYQRRRKAW